MKDFNITVVFDTEYFNELLIEKNMTRIKLAEITGINKHSISNYSIGKYTPTAKVLYIIALALDVTMEDLLKEI